MQDLRVRGLGIYLRPPGQPPHSPLQLAELQEDLIALVLHLPMDAQDLHSLQQDLQGLPIVFHTRTRAVQERESTQPPGTWVPKQGRMRMRDPLGTAGGDLRSSLSILLSIRASPETCADPDMGPAV